LVVWHGEPDTWSSIACNDDGDGYSGGISALDIVLFSDHVYYIEVASYSEDTTSKTLYVNGSFVRD
jgi:hypothetical protein